MKKRGQAAMEFLMTYGWAILVVLIALGALFYLGVFSPRTPSTCSVSAPLTCTDVLAKDTGEAVTLVLGATGTSAATLDSVAVTSPAGISGCGPATPVSIATTTPTAITVNCATGDMSIGDKLAGTGTISYTLTGGTAHTTTVTFSGTVEA